MSAPSQSATQAEAEARLRFEMLLADVCADFVNVASADLDSKIKNAQRVICEALAVDHSSVWQVSEGNPGAFLMTHAYRDPDLKPLPSRPVLNTYFPWSQRKILAKEIVCIPDAEDVPPEAATDRESWLQYDIHSALAFPLSVGGGAVIGLLTFDSTKKRDWSESLQRRLQILALVFAQALDRKNSEQKVRESENRFRLVADTAPVLIWMSGTDKLCTYFNKPWLDFTGRSLQEQLGNGWAEGVHAEDLRKRLDTYTQAFDRHEKFRMEYRLRRHDGQYRWVLDIGVPRFNQEHSFAGYIGIGVDVTDRRLTDEARFRLAAIVESSEDAIISGTLDGIIVSWNAGAQRTYGYTEAEAVGKPITMLVPPDLLDEENKIRETLKAGNRIEQFETVRLAKGGKRINISLSISAIKDSSGRIVGISGIARDITQQKQTQDELRASEERVRLAQWAAHIGTYDLNLRTGVDIWQPETEALYGLPAGSFGGTLAAFENLIHPDDRERIKQLSGEMVRTGQPAEAEWRVVWPDGSVHWIAGRGQVFMTDCGEPSRMLGVNMDISERKRAEEALSEMTRKLVEAQEQERSRIGRELHDDINQRLAMLAIELEQLQDNPSEMGIHIRELRKQVTDISKDVQALSHDLHSSQLEYLGFVAGMKSWCKEFAERQGMQIECRDDVQSTLPGEIGLCLFRVLQEAMHNAAKHSGVKRIEVELREEAGDAHLIVRDSGKGFDAEAVKQGKGLGLISMRERARLVDGTISIESKPMGGTKIHVRVPLGSKHAPEREAV